MRAAALGSGVCVLAVRVAVTFSVMPVMLQRVVSMIFFIVSCGSISDMAVPFNLYSLGYFLKRFIEHYPKLNCIYYPLTQLLKWFHIHLIFILRPLGLRFSSPFPVSHTGAYSVPKSLPSQTTQLEQNDTPPPPSPQLSIWILATSAIQFYKNSRRSCFVTGLSEGLFVPVPVSPLEWICLAKVSDRGVGVGLGEPAQLWILSAHFPNPNFNSSGFLSALLGQLS